MLISIYTYMKQTGCPIAKVAELLSDTWTILIIRDLLKKPKRFCELERSLVGISTRTLTLKLNRLQEKQIILKTEKGYLVTKQARKIGNIIRAMERFGGQDF